jgi:hypothetical protein
VKIESKNRAERSEKLAVCPEKEHRRGLPQKRVKLLNRLAPSRRSHVHCTRITGKISGISKAVPTLKYFFLRR